MFRIERRQTILTRALDLWTLIFHTSVRQIRAQHGNSAVLGLLKAMLGTVTMIVMFYFFMSLMGMRRMAIRGDFVLYLMSGIFLYMTHRGAISAVFKSEGPTSPMMLHAPMNTVVAITAAAIGSLYIQVLNVVVVLYIYHVAFGPITIDQPLPAFGMLLLSWFSGIGVGMVFLAIKPWFPTVAGAIQAFYTRANMMASGKMFVANSLNFTMLYLFMWNPLFHTIDQCRGYVFLNYTPHHTSASYAFYFTLPLLVIGLMGEFFARRNVSASRGKLSRV